MERILRERSFIRNRRDEVPTRRRQTSGCGACASAAPRTEVAGANMKSDQSARTYDQVPQKTLVEVCPLSELKPGDMRLLEWEDLEIGVFNCAGTVYAIEDRCSHDNGPLVEGELDEDGLHDRVPPSWIALRPQDGTAQDLACLSSRGDVSGDHRREHNQSGGGVVATPETIPAQSPPLTGNEGLARINADYEQRYGFHDAENYLYKAPKGLNREIVEKISEFKDEPQWMRDFRLKALDHFLARPAAHVGLAAARRGQLRRHPLLRPRLREARTLLGRRARGRQAHIRPAGHPRGRA